MKISYNWLKEYCRFDLSAEELAAALTEVGLVVEEVTPLADGYRLDVEVTSNRPDCLCHLGIAREVAAITRGKVRLPEVDYMPEKIPVDFRVRVEDLELCPRYTARIIRGVKVGPSPSWLQKHLDAVGLRPVNNVVDVTNYVLLETSQPLHAFDMDRLKGNKIVVRRAASGEALKTIDGMKCELTPETLVIADGERPVALAGVMGGVDTEVGEATTNIVLESARFRPSAVRRAAKRFVLSTDSSYRFERGVDPEGVDWASRRATRLIQELAGGKVAREVVDIGSGKTKKSVVTVRMPRLNALLGTKVEPGAARDILLRLGFEAKAGRDKVVATVPSFRNDVTREVDLIEEVARIYGYNNIPADTRLSIQVKPRSRYEQVEERARELLTGWGLTEVVTCSIIDDLQHRRFSASSGRQPLTLRNPIRKDEDLLRQTLLGNLLRVKRHNQDRGTPGVRIFEIARVYLPADSVDKLPEERNRLCLLWEEELAGAEEAFSAVKGVLEGVFSAFGLKGVLKWQGCPGAPFEEKRSCRVEMDGAAMGVLGEVEKGLVEEYDLNSHPVMAEVDFDAIVEMADLGAVFKKLPLYPPAVRDMAVVVDERVGWADVERCIKESGLEYLESIEFFDLYRGKQVAAGKKSLAFKLCYRAPDRTLRGEEINEMQKLVEERLDRELHAALR
ncbi:MAG: phenylalanine--tRNA ligase subunit beta, partial [Candidatus Brocadiales bacterium]